MAQPLRAAIELSLQSVVDILAVAIPDDPDVPQPANQPAELDEVQVFIGTLRNEEDELRQLTQTLLTSTASWSNVIAKLPNADRPAAEDAFANYQLNANYQDRLRNGGRRIRTLRQRIDAAELRARTLRRAIAAAAPPPAVPAVPVVAQELQLLQQSILHIDRPLFLNLTAPLHLQNGGTCSMPAIIPKQKYRLSTNSQY